MSPLAGAPRNASYATSTPPPCSAHDRLGLGAQPLDHGLLEVLQRRDEAAGHRGRARRRGDRPAPDHPDSGRPGGARSRWPRPGRGRRWATRRGQRSRCMRWGRSCREPIHGETLVGPLRLSRVSAAQPETVTRTSPDSRPESVSTTRNRFTPDLLVCTAIWNASPLHRAGRGEGRPRSRPGTSGRSGSRPHPGGRRRSG